MNGKFKPGHLKSKEFLKSIVNQELDELNKLDDEAKNKKNEDLCGLIKYYFELNKNTEEKCLRLSNFSLQFLVLCIMGVGAVLLYQETLGLMLLTIFLSFFSLHVLYALLIVAAHESGSRTKDYLYAIETEDGGQKPDAEKKTPLKSIFNTFSNLRSSKGDPTTYLGSVRSFVRNFHEEDINQKIINNMEQLYLFQAENSYCIKLFFRIKRLRFWSFVTSMGASMAIGLAFVALSGGFSEWLILFKRMF
jgi:hypothetical protein